MKRSDKKGKSELVSVLIVAIIVAMLVFSGPASAVHVDMSGPASAVIGETVDFSVNVTIEADERIPIDNVTVTGLPFGPLDFSASGTKISGDGRYSVSLIESTAPYGYGYGYGYSETYGYGYTFYGGRYGYGYGYGYTGAPGTHLKYKITVDTTGASEGSYNIKAIVYSEGNPYFQSSGETFTLTKPALPTPSPTPPPRRGGGGGAPPRDSDGDGISDTAEILAGTDPNDPCDPNPECAACLALKPAATPTPTPAVTPTPTATPVPTPVATPTPTPTPEEKLPVKWALIIGGITAVIVVGAAAYYFYMKK